jgi:DNA repair protein RecO (recombination protein O)
MLLKTRGIVFRSIKYGESSIITDIFTEEKGLLSYIINGVRKRKAKISPGYFQVMSVLDLVVYHSDQQKLHRIKEVKPAFYFQKIPFDVQKSSITLFLAELCSKTITEPEPNPHLFDFIAHALRELDEADTQFQNHHLSFMVGLAQEFGFELQPQRSSEDKFFDLQESQFQSEVPMHVHYIAPPISHLLAQFIQNEKNGSYTVMDRSSRRALLTYLVTYFRLHIDHLKDLKSYHVLAEVL